MTIAQDFERELEVFRQEADAATQVFFCSRGLNLTGLVNRDALRALNQHKPFWITVLAAFQQTTLMTLGRIFDPDPKANHGITRLFVLLMKDRAMFSRGSLSGRKAGILQGADLERYLDEAFYPTPADLQAMKVEVGTWRSYYDQELRGLRHRAVAHRDAVGADEIPDLWSRTDVRDVERLLVDLRHMHRSLFDLYFNGIKPRPSSERISAIEMLASPSAAVGGRPLPEVCAKAAGDVIATLAEGFANLPMTREEREADRQRMYAAAQLNFEVALQERSKATGCS